MQFQKPNMHINKIIETIQRIDDSAFVRLANIEDINVKKDFLRFLTTFELVSPMEFQDWHEAWGRYYRTRLSKANPLKAPSPARF